MTEYVAVRSKNRRPTAPGQVLANTVVPKLKEQNLTKAAIAKLLGVSRPTFYDVLSCKQPITPQMAVRIGKLCGNGPDLWIRMQAACDIWDARNQVDVSKIPTLEFA